MMNLDSALSAIKREIEWRDKRIQELEECVKHIGFGKDLPLAVIFDALTALAKRHDGHVTLMRFTTGWKIVFGTPQMDSREYDWLFSTIPAKMSLLEAFTFAGEHQPDIYSDPLEASKGNR